MMNRYFPRQVHPFCLTVHRPLSTSAPAYFAKPYFASPCCSKVACIHVFLCPFVLLADAFHRQFTGHAKVHWTSTQTHKTIDEAKRSQEPALFSILFCLNHSKLPAAIQNRDCRSKLMQQIVIHFLFNLFNGVFRWICSGMD